MKVRVQEVVEGLKKVRPGLSTNELIEQSDSFLFREGLVFTFDGEVSVSTKSPFGDEIEGGVKAEPLVQLFSRLKDEEVDATVKEGSLIIEGTKSKAGLPIEEEVKLQTPKPPKDWEKIDGGGFIEAVKLAEAAASDNASRPILTCLHMTPKFIEACDNFRMTRAFLTKGGGPQDLCFSAESARSLVRGFEPTALGLAGGKEDAWVHFRCKGGVVFSCRRVVGEYPDLTKLLKVEGETLTLKPKATKAALHRAQVFSATEFSQDEKVLVRMKEGVLQIRSKGPQGWFKETVGAKGPDCLFHINPSFFTHALDLGCELIVTKDRIKLQGDSFVHVVCLEQAPEKA